MELTSLYTRRLHKKTPHSCLGATVKGSLTLLGIENMVPFTADQTEVCSEPRLRRTRLELDSEEMEALSRFFGFFRLDRRGPWPLPAKKKGG